MACFLAVEPPWENKIARENEIRRRSFLRSRSNERCKMILNRIFAKTLLCIVKRGIPNFDWIGIFVGRGEFDFVSSHECVAHPLPHLFKFFKFSRWSHGAMLCWRCDRRGKIARGEIRTWKTWKTIGRTEILPIFSRKIGITTERIRSFRELPRICEGLKKKKNALAYVT